MRRITLIAPVIALWMSAARGTARADELALPSESILARSQASVFLVVSYADYNLTIPKKVAFVPGPDGAPLVFADYEALRAADKIKPGVSKSDVCWFLIAEGVGRYLKVTENETKREPMELSGSGTAFAVSKEGILLTNAHNVLDPADGDVPMRTLFTVLDRTIDELSGLTAAEQLIGRAGGRPQGSSLGGRPPQGLVTPLTRTLFTWLHGQSGSANNKFQQVAVVLDYQDKPDPSRPFSLLPAASSLRVGSPQTQRAMRGMHDDMALIELMSGRAVSRFATVLARGEPYPGKDVAVLKLGPGPRGAATDAVVCLPMGDSDRVRLGSSVLALGFPGAAFDPENMKPEARYRVITEDGKITQRVPYKTGVEFFHMTAQINHGHSGGPVVDQYGRVVAINVAKLQDNIRLAVPVNVAQEFLDRAGIKPDPGDVTKHWQAGHDLFQKGSYAEAEREFIQVADRQNPDRSRPGTRLGTGSTPAPANSYVEAMIRECRIRATSK